MLEELKIIAKEGVKIKIPECCAEALESCPHGAPKLKKEKRHIAL